MGGLGVKVQHFPLTLLVVLTTLTLPCERDECVTAWSSDPDILSGAAPGGWNPPYTTCPSYPTLKVHAVIFHLAIRSTS